MSELRERMNIFLTSKLIQYKTKKQRML